MHLLRMYELLVPSVGNSMVMNDHRKDLPVIVSNCIDNHCQQSDRLCF